MRSSSTQRGRRPATGAASRTARTVRRCRRRRPERRASTERRSASMRSIRKKARSALPSSVRIAPRSAHGRSAPSFRQRSRSVSSAADVGAASARHAGMSDVAGGDRAHRLGDLRRASRRRARGRRPRTAAARRGARPDGASRRGLRSSPPPRSGWRQIGLVVAACSGSNMVAVYWRMSRLRTSIAAKCSSASSGAVRHAARDAEEQRGGLEIARRLLLHRAARLAAGPCSRSRVEIARLRIILDVLRRMVCPTRDSTRSNTPMNGKHQRRVEDVEGRRIEADRDRHQREGLLAVDDHRARPDRRRTSP